MSEQKHSFQTEVKQLLQLMIHSLYSNKEIFLRELISNAADAIDKLRFESLKTPNLLKDNEPLKIIVTADQDQHTLTVEDNGIGMSEKEIIENLGTIAHSGTKAFLHNLTGDQKKDAHLIGQFGVGFYSSFIVADSVTVESRSAYEESNQGVCWLSDGNGEFTVKPITKDRRGTKVILHIKKEDHELLSDWTLRRIVTTYSDHISVPIYMKKAPTYDDKGKMIESDELESVNQGQALWTHPKNEITKAQYQEFYKHSAHDFTDPLAWTHFKVEGKQEFTGLLYIPSHPPFDLNQHAARKGLKLYVKRVFIMDDAEKLLPAYLRFVRGTIDSSDLPLNVSREILQESKALETIKAGSVKKVLDLLEKLFKNEKDTYKTFWNFFGAIFKEGMAEDHKNKERIASLSLFRSSKKDANSWVSLDEYIKQMPENQDKIYYLTADNYAEAKNIPHLEIFLKKDIEVLLLTDRVDEWVVSALNEYKGKALTNIVKGELNLDKNAGTENNNQESEKEHKEKEAFIEPFQKALGDKVAGVRLTERLVESPACLVVKEDEVTPHLARLLENTGANDLSFTKAKPTLEINPKHPLVARVVKETNLEKQASLARLIYDEALLAEGGKLENPAEFIKKMNELILSY